MNIMDDIISAVKGFSPLLATALGSPLSGIALSLLGSAFGSTSKSPEEILSLIHGDPLANLKIKELEYHHAEELGKISSDDYKTEVDDRKNAREKEKEVKDHTPSNLAYILTVGIFSSLFYLFTNPVPTKNRELIVSILSAMTTVWIAAMAYYHGSSVGSKNKEKMLDKK